MRVFKRYKNDPNWHIDFRYVDQRGRRKRCIKKIGPSKALARRVLKKMAGKAAEARYFPERNKLVISFAEAAHQYWELHARHKPSHRTTKYALKQFNKAFGSKPLDQVTVPDVLNYLNEVRAKFSAASANRKRNILNAIFNRAIEWEKFQGPNPVSKVKPFRIEHQRERFLSKDEVARLLDVCPPRLYSIVVCAIMTGMRKGELLGLIWDNVSLEQDIIYVLKSKSGKAREIPITSTLRRVLVDLGPKSEGSVFEISEMSVRRYFAAALKSAQIKDFRFHDLRHTFASHHVMRTNDLPATQKLLGHQSPAMTQRYAHLSKGHLKIGMQIFDSGWETIGKLGSSRKFEEDKKSLDLQHNAGVVQW